MEIENLIITVPFPRAFSDYHEIPLFAEMLTEITGHHVKSIEINETEIAKEIYNDYGHLTPYVGLFYVGKKPTKNDIRYLIEYAGYSS